MDSRARAAFGLLILAQGAHSVEEYAFRLFEVFGPARFVSGLFSDNIATGFALANIGIVLAGLWCYLARVRTPHPSERAYAWSWICLELGNGVGHLVLSGVGGGYFPGAATAPLLIAVSSYLGARLMKWSTIMTTGPSTRCEGEAIEQGDDGAARSDNRPGHRRSAP